MAWFHRRPAQPLTRTYGPLNDLLDLTPGEFEKEVARLLARQGYRDIRRVGGGGDLGVDIFCVDELGNRVAVQCKRYAPERKIGSPVLQTFFGMIAHHGAHRGLYVTTSGFTDPARTFASQRDIDLIDGPELAKQIVSPGSHDQSNHRRQTHGGRWICPHCLSTMKSTERRCSGCLRDG